MNWIDIASIVFVCVTANHLGLIGTIEEIMGKIPLFKKYVPKWNHLPIISCPRCFTLWSVLAYGLWSVGFSDIPLILAVSFLASYTAIWLELLEGYIDTLYMKLYGKITSDNTDDTTAADPDKGNSAGSVS